MIGGGAYRFDLETARGRRVPVYIDPRHIANLKPLVPLAARADYVAREVIGKARSSLAFLYGDAWRTGDPPDRIKFATAHRCSTIPGERIGDDTS